VTLHRFMLAIGMSLLFLGCACTDPNVIPPITAVRAPADLGKNALGHVTILVSYGPRHTGAVGWTNGINYISNQLTAMGLNPVKDTWLNGVEGLSFTNISVTLPGKSKDKIVIGCHHDTKKCQGHPDPAHNFSFVGANDSGSGVGLLLELARVLKDKDRKATYELVFFDGEESLPWKWDIDRALFGSKRYVRRYEQAMLDDPSGPKIQAFMLVDMVGAKDLQIDEEENSDQDLRDVLFKAAQAAGHEKYFFQNRLPVIDDHIPFVNAGIRSIDLIDIHVNDEWHTEKDVLAHLSADSLHVVGEVVLTALPAIEKRYFTAVK